MSALLPSLALLPFCPFALQTLSVISCAAMFWCFVDYNFTPQIFKAS